MPPSESIHVPVLSEEVISWLQPRAGQTLVDGTLGGGGHTELLSQAVGPDGLVIAVDRDPLAVSKAVQIFQDAPVQCIQENFCNLPEVLTALELTEVDAVLLDLGISSDQLQDEQRGFSFHAAGELDLRFDPTRGEPAWKLLNRLSAGHLADLIYEYGEERYSRRVARKIVEARNSEPIRTAKRLAEIVRSCVPRSRGHSIDPATRTFQALRIAVNEELKSLEIALRRIPDCLRQGGRFAVISFHSLEDRRVKQAFRDEARLEVLTKKAIKPTEGEARENPRSRSARLRVACRAAVDREEQV